MINLCCSVGSIKIGVDIHINQKHMCAACKNFILYPSFFMSLLICVIFSGPKYMSSPFIKCKAEFTFVVHFIIVWTLQITVSYLGFLLFFARNTKWLYLEQIVSGVHSTLEVEGGPRFCNSLNRVWYARTASGLPRSSPWVESNSKAHSVGSFRLLAF